MSFSGNGTKLCGILYTPDLSISNLANWDVAPSFCAFPADHSKKLVNAFWSQFFEMTAMQYSFFTMNGLSLLRADACDVTIIVVRPGPHPILGKAILAYALWPR